MQEYGFWLLVVFNSAIFIFFALTFFRPTSRRDWRSFGAFSAFLVALFTEMYGFWLRIYFLYGWSVGGLFSSHGPGPSSTGHSEPELLPRRVPTAEFVIHNTSDSF